MDVKYEKPDVPKHSVVDWGDIDVLDVWCLKSDPDALLLRCSDGSDVYLNNGHPREWDLTEIDDEGDKVYVVDAHLVVTSVMPEGE